MKHKVARALSLSRGEWWILTRAWVLLLLVDVGLRIPMLPFRRLQKILTPKPQRADEPQPGDVLVTIMRLRRWVDIASRHHLYPMTCLRRSLVLQRLLGQQGIAVDLQIGVRKTEEKLDAHAWLEHHGQPIGEPGSITRHFSPLTAPGAEQPVVSNDKIRSKDRLAFLFFIKSALRGVCCTPGRRFKSTITQTKRRGLIYEKQKHENT